MENNAESSKPVEKNTDVEETSTCQNIKPKNLEFLPNWRELLKSYSFIFHALSALLTFIEIILPHMFLIEPMFTPAAYGVTMFVLNVLGGLGRLIKQRNIPD